MSFLQTGLISISWKLAMCPVPYNQLSHLIFKQHCAFPFYRWRCWSSERLSNFPKISQLASGKNAQYPISLLLHSLCPWPLCYTSSLGFYLGGISVGFFALRVRPRPKWANDSPDYDHLSMHMCIHTLHTCSHIHSHRISVTLDDVGPFWDKGHKDKAMMSSS